MQKQRPPIDTAARSFSPRLMDALSAVFERPLAFIHAPMGFGKTVGAREALRRSKATIIWTPVLTDNAEVFWRDFCHSLHKALPEEKETLNSLEALGYPADSVKTDAARETLSRLAFSPDTVLVFDDIHQLPEQESGGLVRLCLLLARQRSGEEGFPRMVAISRHGPDEALADPVLKGLAAVAGPELFTLTAAEIREYYERCGVSLTTAKAAELCEITGGWISALYLYLLQYSPNEEAASPTTVHTLLSNGIFDTLPEATKDLLLALSPLEHITAPQARYLSAGAENALKDLARRNAFIIHDPETESYTFHALFRNFLTTRFAKLPRKRQQAVHRKNAAWFVRQNDVTNAVRFLHAAQDFAKGLALVEENAARIRVTETNGHLMRFFRACPQDLLDAYPSATFRYAMAALSSKDMPVFGEQLARLERYCASLPEDDPAANRWRGELEMLRAFTKYNDFGAMSVHHILAGEFFAKSDSSDIRSRFFGLEPLTLGSPSVLYMFHRQSGKLSKALAELREGTPPYTRVTGMHGAGMDDMMQAEAQYHAGEFEAAAISCHRAMATAMEHGQTCFELCALFLFARLQLLQGRNAQAMDLLHVMRERVEEKKSFALLHTVDLCKGFVCASLNKPEEIPGWLRQGTGEDRLYAFAGGSSHLVHGRALLLDEKYTELAGKFSHLLQSGAFAKNVLFTLYAHIFIAAANTALGKKALADASLNTALELALPDRLYMPFAENADFLPQIKTMSRKKLHREGVRHILRLAVAMGKLSGRAANGNAPQGALDAHSLLALLTKRERELTRFALTGKTYPEIAASLGLAPTTIKRAFITIHKKLGVSSREQLAARFGKK